jgi:DNA polymerase-3 subunit beta
MKPSISTDYTRKYLTGMFFHDKKIVATDGHKMSLLNDSSVNFEGIISYKPLKMITDTKQSVDIAIKGDYAIFYTENVTIYSKLVEGPSPQYQNVMPSVFEKKFIITKELLVNALKNMNLTRVVGNLVKFSFEKDKQSVNLSYNLDGNVFSKDVPCVWDEIVDFTIGYSGKYLIELLNTIDSNDIQFNFNSQLGPTKIHKVGYWNDFNIIMPLRLKDED